MTLDDVWVVRGQDWRTRAACKGLTDLFFPGDGDSWTAVQAKTVCETCPVRRECREFAQDSGERFGVWGGIAMNRKRRRAA